ncbi:MAG: alpha-glucan family phosphorylase [Candidatus Omnitrophica bacterium]|nr:alpha-glucan family phosphorylase [Candidatus Omnitrophota bacterium]
MVLKEFLSLVEVDRYNQRYQQTIADEKYFGMPLPPIVDTEKRLRQKSCRGVAYFSMEYGLATSFYNCYRWLGKPADENYPPKNSVFSNHRLADCSFELKSGEIIDLPIYSGGLGVLAGDTIKTFADYKLPVVGVGILWHSGYFRQKFWYKHGQVPQKMRWDPSCYPGLIPLKNVIKIELPNESIFLRIWKYYVYSYKHDFALPLILLDADLPGNRPEIRDLTDQLYRSDNAWLRIMQRIVLGYGGVLALKELGYNIKLFHLNEGHAALSFIEKCRGRPKEEIASVREEFVYTCHTPVEAGHDRFVQEDLKNILSKEDFVLLEEYGIDKDNLVNLTILAINACSSVNAVSKSHQRVMSHQFPEYKDRIGFVTNGVHPYTWISEEFYKVFKRFSTVFSDIDHNPMILSRAKELKKNKGFRHAIWSAHQANKQKLCRSLEKWGFKQDVFTLCWARRIAAYKRPSLLLYDTEQLVKIARETGPLQIILAGKAHPQDNLGFTFINEMMDKVDKLDADYQHLKVAILENYDLHLAKLLTESVDLWLNNPLPPYEASGTSGMKAILNGVVQLSTLDGWMVEAKDMGIGRIFGYQAVDLGSLTGELQLHMRDDSQELYAALRDLAGIYYKTNNAGSLDLSSPWIDMMVDCIAAGGSFNTYRMLDEYKSRVWPPK